MSLQSGRGGGHESHLEFTARGIFGRAPPMAELIELQARHCGRLDQYAATIRKGQAKKLATGALARVIWLRQQLPDLVAAMEGAGLNPEGLCAGLEGTQGALAELGHALWPVRSAEAL